MKYYTTIYINVVSFVVSIIIFLIITNFQNIITCNKYLKNEKLKVEFKVEKQEDKEENNVNKESKGNKSNKNNESKKIKKNTEVIETKKEWILEIPKINLKANIKEGTSKEILDKAIGHFEETVTEKGNIALAAHNRGYKVNYFENLKKLKEGDIIKYKHNYFEKEYEIISHIIIKDTDFSMLENTRENRITLITCVENEPEYRRCIQAIERNENKNEK